MLLAYRLSKKSALKHNIWWEIRVVILISHHVFFIKKEAIVWKCEK